MLWVSFPKQKAAAHHFWNSINSIKEKPSLAFVNFQRTRYGLPKKFHWKVASDKLKTA